MSELRHYLDETAVWLRRLKRPLAGLLRPGLSEEKILEKTSTFPFCFSRELIELYQWHDGVADRYTTPMRDTAFFGIYSFMSLDEAVQEYRSLIEINEELKEELTDEQMWDQLWFPFLTDSSADYYLASLSSETTDSSPVVVRTYDFEEFEQAFSSLESMFATLSNGYATGAIYPDSEGFLSVNWTMWNRIRNDLEKETS